jgi:hypothetical protein
MSKIYKLIDPTTNKIRYVGKTEKELSQRLLGHINDLTRKRRFENKQQWIKELLKIGYCPLISLLEECNSEISSEREIYWINLLKRDNNLLNIISNNFLEHSEFVSSHKSKKVYQYSITGDFIFAWNSITEASISLDTENSNICFAAGGKRKLAGDYQWRYYKKDNIGLYTKDIFKKKVYKYDYEGNFICEYSSGNTVDDIKPKLISKCCNGSLKTVYGFRYSFEKMDKLEPLIRKIRKDKKIKDIV